MVQHGESKDQRCVETLAGSAAAICAEQLAISEAC